MRTLHGDLAAQVPVGLAVIVTVALTPAETAALKAIEDRLRPVPLLCLEVQDAADLVVLRPQLQRLLSPATPTVILAQDMMDRSAQAVARQLGNLGLDPDGPMPGGTGHPARPDIFNGRHGLTLNRFAPYLERARQQWPQAIQQGDDAYWCRLKEWANEAARPVTQEAVHRIMAELVSWVESTNARVTGTHTLTLDLGGLTTPPPLPPRNIGQLFLRGGGALGLHPQPDWLTRRVVVTLDDDPHRAPGPFDPAAWQSHGRRADLPGEESPDEEPQAPPVARLQRRVPVVAEPPMHTPHVATPGMANELTRLLGLQGAMDGSGPQHLMGTPSFVTWLQRLDSLPSKQRERFVQGVADLIHQCLRDEALRKLVLAVVEDASSSCDDRVTLTWERVRLLVRCQGILRGDFDKHLDQVIALARQALRQEIIGQIAHEHAQEARLQRAAFVPIVPPDQVEVEEVEIHLAYLSQAAGPLGIELDAGFGRFIDSAISGVSLRDVSRALKRVKHMEGVQFLDFLTHWEPWVRVLRRLAPASMAAIDDDCADLERIGVWQVEARHSAIEAGLQGRECDDAVTKALALRGNELRAQRLTELTVSLLGERDQAHLLEPAWPRQ